MGNNKNGLLAERDQLTEAWRSFLAYIVRTAPESGLGKGTITILIKSKTPVAWKINWEGIPGFATDRPGDALNQWEGFVRHILAMAKDNSGYASVESQVVTHNKRPSMWLEAEVRRIYPMETTSILGEETILRILFPTYTKVDSKI